MKYKVSFYNLCFSKPGQQDPHEASAANRQGVGRVAVPGEVPGGAGLLREPVCQSAITRLLCSVQKGEEDR